ncbi:hypothetical protein [Propionivibrio sp.]|uniref:hypothetical protein n=1 Tax=Propionivibrio sp. TaxID=2212460 RepID=UPI0039E228FA
MKRLWLVIYPELGRFPEAERKEALRRANLGDFDGIELAGMAFGLIATTALTRFAAAATPAGYLLELLACFCVAVPLLALFVGPFLIRRTRRGLRLHRSRRHSYHREAHS